MVCGSINPPPKDFLAYFAFRVCIYISHPHAPLLSVALHTQENNPSQPSHRQLSDVAPLLYPATTCIRTNYRVVRKAVNLPIQDGASLYSIASNTYKTPRQRLLRPSMREGGCNTSVPEFWEGIAPLKYLPGITLYVPVHHNNKNARIRGSSTAPKALYPFTFLRHSHFQSHHTNPSQWQGELSLSKTWSDPRRTYLTHKLATFPHTVYGLGAKMSHVPEAQKDSDRIVTRVAIVSARCLFQHEIDNRARQVGAVVVYSGRSLVRHALSCLKPLAMYLVCGLYHHERGAGVNSTFIVVLLPVRVLLEP